MPDIQPLLLGKENESRESWKLLELAFETTHYIRDVVWHLLSRTPSQLDYLSCFKDACMDNKLSGIDIFTLNHDTVLEQYLSHNTIQVIDGFSVPQNDVRYWDPYLFESQSSKIRLFKLHGSVNWFRFQPDDGDWSSISIGIPLDWDFWHTKSPQGQMQRPINGRPMLLVGTFNKMFDYLNSIYADLHCQFHYALRRIEQLIICGYSFGDKGINNRIFEWVYSSKDHKLVIINQSSEEELLRKARGVLISSWDKLVKQKKLTFISKGIENISWLEIRDKLL